MCLRPFYALERSRENIVCGELYHNKKKDGVGNRGKEGEKERQGENEGRRR